MEAACIPVAGQGFQQRAESILHQVQTLRDGYVKIHSPGIEWFIYCQKGQVVYVSNSIDPFERLSRALRGCLQANQLDGQALALQARIQFEQASGLPGTHTPQADHQVLAWLATTAQVTPELHQRLIHRLNLEVMESLCLLPEQDFHIEPVEIAAIAPLPATDFRTLYQEAETRLNQWQAYRPLLFSPYQRPYLSGVPLTKSNLGPEVQTRLRQILIGFSWRQIAMLMGQDELALAAQFFPLIQQGVIKLHDPFSPFDKLPWQRQERPQSPTENVSTATAAVANDFASAPPPASPLPAPPSPTNQAVARNTPTGATTSHATLSHAPPASPAPLTKTWKIVCIDDSPAVLNEINRFLQADLFSVTLISDSKKALMKINSIKPDLILLDANMPGVDGYQVCTMLRKSSLLKHIPVIMVTGNRGLVNRAKAKIAGITDYLNKPFTQKDLLEMIFRHISQ